MFSVWDVLRGCKGNLNDWERLEMACFLLEGKNPWLYGACLVALIGAIRETGENPSFDNGTRLEVESHEGD